MGKTPKEVPGESPSKNTVVKKNVDTYEQEYKNVVTSIIGDTSHEEIDNIVQYLLQHPVVSKREMGIFLKMTKDEIDNIINHLKKGGIGEKFILIKPKSLIGPEKEGIKFYYNKDAKDFFASPEAFFMASNELYTHYFLEKLEEYIDGEQENYETDTDFIKHLAGIIEFPYDYTENMLAYLQAYNCIEINQNHNLSFSKNAKILYPILKNIHFENEEVSLDENKYLTNFILDTLSSDPTITLKKLENHIKNTFGFPVNKTDLQSFQRESLKSMKKGEIDSLYNTNFAGIKLKKKYKIENGAYIFTFKKENHAGEKIKEQISISVAEVDELFFLYSSRGANMTQKQVIEALRIKEDIWGIIKTRLSLTKQSDIVSPYTIETFGNDDKKREKYTTQAYVNYQKQKLRTEGIENERKEVYKMKKRVELIISNYEGFKKDMRSIIEKRKPRTIAEIHKQVQILKKNKELTISFSDIHFGKIGHDQVIKRLQQIIEYVGNSDAEKVNLLCLGDLAETLIEGGMHNGQKEKMDWSGKNSFEMIMSVVDILENFLVALYRTGKKIDFYGIGGNHDRLGKKHDEDKARTGALMIYELTKRGLLKYEEADSIMVDYGIEKWNVLQRDGFDFILHHGDNGATSKGLNTPTDILWNERKKLKHDHALILMGDKHHLQMKNPVEGANFLQVPALAGKGEYDTDLGLSSYPGFAIIEKGFNGYPGLGVQFLK